VIQLNHCTRKVCVEKRYGLTDVHSLSHADRAGISRKNRYDTSSTAGGRIGGADKQNTLVPKSRFSSFLLYLMVAFAGFHDETFTVG
jgi:hypothetical protein